MSFSSPYGSPYEGSYSRIFEEEERKILEELEKIERHESSSTNMLLVLVVIGVVVVIILLLLNKNKNKKHDGSGGHNPPVEIRNKTELDSLMNSRKPYGIMFYANWCGACTQTKPIFAEAAKKASIPFYTMESANIPREMNIQSYPTIYFHNSLGQNVLFNEKRTVTNLVNAANATHSLLQ